MKLKLFASAAIAAAMIAAPAFADDMAGQVDVSYGFHGWDYSNGGSNYDNTDLTLGGAFTNTFSNGVVMQIDGQGDLYNWDNSSGDDSLGYVAAHFAQRNDNYAIGAFAGLENYYGDGGIMVGLEGQAYMPELTFTGSVSYIHFNDSNDYDVWGANIGARYFINDNFALDAGLGWASWDTSFTDYDGWNGTLGAEYKFDGSPASVFATYRRDAIDYTFNDYTVDSFTFGVRLTLGSDTLRARTNDGASFGGARAAHDNMVRW